MNIDMKGYKGLVLTLIASLVFCTSLVYIVHSTTQPEPQIIKARPLSVRLAVPAYGNQCDKKGYVLFHKTEPPDHKCMQECKKADYKGEGWSKGPCPAPPPATATNIPPLPTNTPWPVIMTWTPVPPPATATSTPIITNTKVPGDKPEPLPTQTLVYDWLTPDAVIETLICDPLPNCEVCCNEEAIDEELYARAGMWEAVTKLLEQLYDVGGLELFTN